MKCSSSIFGMAVLGALSLVAGAPAAVLLNRHRSIRGNHRDHRRGYQSLDAGGIDQGDSRNASRPRVDRPVQAILRRCAAATPIAKVPSDWVNLKGNRERHGMKAKIGREKILKDQIERSAVQIICEQSMDSFTAWFLCQELDLPRRSTRVLSRAGKFCKSCRARPRLPLRCARRGS
jgi:hypothetical protein